MFKKITEDIIDNRYYLVFTAEQAPYRHKDFPWNTYFLESEVSVDVVTGYVCFSFS